MPKPNILVFAAHPDDDIIGCGGSLAKFSGRSNVTVAYMTSGDAGSRTYPKEELARIRETEAKEAATVLGVEDLVFLRNPDGYLQANQDNMVRAINLIRSKKPDIIYTHAANDAHSDHRTTNQIVAQAVFRAAGPWFQETEGEPWTTDTVLAFEVWTPLQSVHYVEDISETVDKKLRALREHKSQISDIEYDQWVEGLNRYRGGTTGVGKFAEAFEAIKVGGTLPALKHL